MSRHDTDRDGNGLPFPYEDRTAPMQVPPVVQRQSDKPKRNGSGWQRVLVSVLILYLGFLGSAVWYQAIKSAQMQNDIKWLTKKFGREE